MGIVYEATHLRLNRKRAIKLLQPEYALDQDFRARFLKEAELASELEHPNAVSVYDAGDVAGHLISWSSSQVL